MHLRHVPWDGASQAVGFPQMSRFRVAMYPVPGTTRHRVLIDGSPRGVDAVQDRHGLWSAEIVSVPLVEGLWSPGAVESWLRDNLDADLLAQRPLDEEN